MEMIFCPLYSGSSGNCLFVQYGATRLLIDAGKSGKMIDEALDMIGVDGNTIDAILITHEHIDQYPKVKALDPNILEAALDLGAKPLKAIRTAIIPQIKETVFAAGAIAFTMSFDDFVISYFTGGSKLNISTYLYTEAKKINPTINALSTIIMLIIVIKIVIDKIKDGRREKSEEN